MPSLSESLAHVEEAIISDLRAKQDTITHRTGKGSETEAIVEKRLLRPYLSGALQLGKGSVVSAEEPTSQSPEIDRLIYDPDSAPPFCLGEHHSIFPIEAICGMVQVTLKLDRYKLKKDIKSMLPIGRCQSVII